MQQTQTEPTLIHPFAEPPAFGTVTEVAPGVLWLRLPLPYRLNHVNIYLVQEADGWVTIDTGLGTDDCRAAWEAVMAGPLAGQKLNSMVVTKNVHALVGASAMSSSSRREKNTASVLNLPRRV